MGSGRTVEYAFEGDAVQTATILFLEMWNALREQDVDI